VAGSGHGPYLDQQIRVDREVARERRRPRAEQRLGERHRRREERDGHRGATQPVGVHAPGGGEGGHRHQEQRPQPQRLDGRVVQ
jgi:hypothetical protein